MTTWMLGHYDIWKAAVTGASVTNQLDQYNLSDSPEIQLSGRRLELRGDGPRPSTGLRAG
jgi:hypothetical protein